MSEEAKPTELTSKDVLLAFRLGWTLSEFMGRAREADYNYRSKSQQPGPRELEGFEAHESPRLSYSDGIRSREGAWWHSALNIVALADALGLLDKENFSKSEEIRGWPEQVYRLSFRTPEAPAKQQVEKLTVEEWLSPRYFYQVLEPWGRQAALALAARGDELALAFTVGGEIADTYWFMRSERLGTGRDRHQDSWHQLLNHRRLSMVIDRLKVIEPYLPPLLGPCLRFTFFRWAVAHDLGYEGDQLIVEYERWLHWFHWWPWVMRRRDAWKERRRQREGRERDKKSRMLMALEAEDEQALRNCLREQVRRWRELIMGERPLESYLNLRARFLLAWQAPLLYFVLLILLAGMAALAGYVLLAIVGGWLAAWMGWALNALVPTQMQPATLKESAEIAKTVVPWLTGLVVFVGGVLRDAWRGAAGLHPRVRNWLVRRKIERAVWVPWRIEQKG